VNMNPTPTDGVNFDGWYITTLTKSIFISLSNPLHFTVSPIQLAPILFVSPEVVFDFRFNDPILLSIYYVDGVHVEAKI